MMRLQGKDLSVSLGGRAILDGLEFRLQAGEMLGLIGPNGAGKTTLLRLLAGLVEKQRGELEIDGEAAASVPLQERARRIAYLAQSGDAQWPLSVERIIALGRLPHLGNWQQPGELDEKLIRQVMRQTDVMAFRERAVNTLSGGERARVLLARALVTEPRVLLADEPVAALDLAHQLEVMALLRNYCAEGGAVVVVLHDLRLAAHYCHRLQLIHDGRTLADGTAQQVLSPDNLKQAFGIRLREDGGTLEQAFELPWELYLGPSPLDP
ncbi:MAG: ABC transporter ATP-binding protein [Sedimenticola sp.]|nr:ABC transporter ATP-binding protein [Sedimenticola sp.]